MGDKEKAKEHPIKEIKFLRTRLTELKKSLCERKKTESWLRESEEFSSSLLNNFPHPLIVINPDTSIRYVNSALEELTGFSFKEVIGRKAPYCWWTKETRKQARKDFKQALQKDAQMVEQLFQKKNRGQFWVETTSRPVRAKKKVKYYLESWVDITARKKTEEGLKIMYSELKETQVQLIQAEKFSAIGQLASGLAHEVRTPLSILIQDINYLEKNLSSKTLKEGISEVLNMMKSNINRADSIVRALIDFSRVEELKMKRWNINSIIGSSLVLMRYKVKLKKIKFVKELEKNLPRISVDRAKIEQVFVNVYLNAIQAMPKGGKLFVRSYLTQVNKVRNGVGRRSGDWFKLGEKALVVEIEDTGAGISEENLKRIFTPFFTTKGFGKGTGLGLSVTRRIIEMHRGLINIRSEEGKGTKVIITLKIQGDR